MGKILIVCPENSKTRRMWEGIFKRHPQAAELFELSRPNPEAAIPTCPDPVMFDEVGQMPEQAYRKLLTLSDEEKTRLLYGDWAAEPETEQTGKR